MTAGKITKQILEPEQKRMLDQIAAGDFRSTSGAVEELAKIVQRIVEILGTDTK